MACRQSMLALIYYIAAVMVTKLFGEGFLTGCSFGASLYTLFQIMTLGYSWYCPAGYC
jgi:voltage-gated sodium channel